MTMIEMLVALVVLAVGMLGIAVLFVTTLRSSGGAIFRMQAVNMAQDMADRIRANPGVNVAYAGAAANNSCEGTLAVADCTPAQMAANDLFVWQGQIAAVLPAGQGTVAVAAPAAPGAPYTYTIQITWNEQSQSAGATAAELLSYTLNIQL